MASFVRYGGFCSPTKWASEGRAGAEGVTSMNYLYSLGFYTGGSETRTTGGWFGFPEVRYAILFS